MEKIRENLIKASKFLIKKQRKDGSWAATKTKHNEPLDYQKNIVITSQCVQTLIHSPPHNSLNSIKNGIYFCSNFKLDSKDPVSWWASKLKALEYSDSLLYEKQKRKIVNYLCRSQKAGYWYSFPRTFNLTNFYVVIALMNFDCDKYLNKTRSWFLRNKAKDKIGWGKDNNSGTSKITFTSNVIIALIATGEDPLSKDLQTARKFIEKNQSKSGGWSSSKLTIKKVTTYSTAISTLALMILSENPFNPKIKNGIKYLINSQSRNGGWPLIKGKKADYYPTYYVTKTLAFYLYLKEEWNKSKTKTLRKSFKPQQVTAFLFNDFENYLKQRFLNSLYSDIINSKVLGTTKAAIKRRKEILKILSNEGSKEVAEILDSLKQNPYYAYINKKSHLTQIKSDVEFLKDLKLVNKIYQKYFIVIDNFL